MLEALTGTGLAASAGLNAYIPLVTMGLLARRGGRVELRHSRRAVLRLVRLLDLRDMLADDTPHVG